MSPKQPRQVFIKSRYVPVADHAEVLRLVGVALEAGKQVSVCPWPNDLNSTVQTYWMVPWPAAHVTERSAA